MKKILYVTEKTVRKVLNERSSYRIAEQTFKLMAAGRTVMPPKVYLDLPSGNDFRAMPAFIGDGKKGLCGLKWVGVFPHNPTLNLPTVLGTILLNSAKSGELLAVLEANTITAMRTGAAGAVAARYMARPDARTLAVVGAGVQAEYQIRAICALFSFERILVWGFAQGEAARLAKRLSQEIKGIRPVDTVQKCVAGADIIITCTPSRKPLVQKNWLKAGVHINAIGADAKGKQELDPLILSSARVIVDEWQQASHSGEINVPYSKKLFTKNMLAGELSDVVSRRVKARTSSTETTVFDSTGLAILDLQFAGHIYSRTRDLS